MKKLNLNEAPKTVAFTFGRFNPPTIGHEKLLDKLKSIRADDYKIFVSHTRNPKRDPLEYSLKIAYMHKSFPKHKRNIIVSKAKTFFDILVELNKYDNLIMVAGSDRVKEFETLANKYNGVKSRHGYYKFENIEIINAGERDPDAEGAKGMSASKMRAAAVDSDFDSFKQGTPLNDTKAKKLYFAVRSAMGIKEELDLSDFETLRDLYLAEQIWNVGELIKVKTDSTYLTWEIIRRGTNYVTVIDENYNTRKIWLHDIEIDDVASRLDKSKEIDEMSGKALGKASDDFKSRSDDFSQGSQFAFLAGLMKTRNHTQLRKDLKGFISRNKKMKDIIVKTLSKHLNPYEVKSLTEESDIEDKDIIIEASVKSGIPYDILRKVYNDEKLTKEEIDILKEYWLIGTEEYDEYLKNLTPGEDSKDKDSLNNKTKSEIKKLRLKNEKS